MGLVFMKDHSHWDSGEYFSFYTKRTPSPESVGIEFIKFNMYLIVCQREINPKFWHVDTKG